MPIDKKRRCSWHGEPMYVDGRSRQCAVKRRAIAVLLLLVVAVPVAAQEPDAHHSLKIPTIVFAGAAAADWITTYRNLSPSGHEFNPLLAPFHDRPVPTVAVGAAMDVAFVWAWNYYVGRRHPKLAAAGLYVAAGLRGALVVSNIRAFNNFNRQRR